MNNINININNIVINNIKSNINLATDNCFCLVWMLPRLALDRTPEPVI